MHWNHRADLPKGPEGQRFHVSVRRGLGEEELVFVRLRPTDHVGALRRLVADAVVGDGNFLLSFQGRVLKDSELAGNVGLHEGAAVYAISHARAGDPQENHMDALLELFNLHGIAHSETEENLFAARHAVGAKRVLTIS